MLKRLMIGLAAAVLVAAMLPGVATAGGPKDMVSGSATFAIDDSHATVHARSDTDGANASGTYRIYVGADDLSVIADVICLHVDGDKAVVGAVVTASSDTGEIPVGAGLLHYVEDNGPPGAPDASRTYVDVDAGECDVVAWPILLQEVQTGNWVVKDRD